uniref:SHSP domain-containing protein n=1 Tax=Ficedula albicollis TaxID=59894 RepID=U3KLF6_FICAL
MLCRMHLAPFASSSLASRLGTVRTLWPHAETIFTELQQEMEKAREFMSSFEQLLSNHGAIAAETTPSSSMTLTQGSGDGFSVCQDVKNFAPEQLSVKVVGRKVVLVGQKETQNVDEKGSFSYKYEVLKREWDVPEEVDAEALTCSLGMGCTEREPLLLLRAVQNGAREQTQRILRGRGRDLGALCC